MIDDLKEPLAAWGAPPLPARVSTSIDALLDDVGLPGPLAQRRPSVPVLPLAYAAAVAMLVLTVVLQTEPEAPALVGHEVTLNRPIVHAPGLPDAAQATAAAVSAIRLDGFEVVASPRIHVYRRTP